MGVCTWLKAPRRPGRKCRPRAQTHFERGTLGFGPKSHKDGGVVARRVNIECIVRDQRLPAGRRRRKKNARVGPGLRKGQGRQILWSAPATGWRCRVARMRRSSAGIIGKAQAPSPKNRKDRHPGLGENKNWADRGRVQKAGPWPPVCHKNPRAPPTATQGACGLISSGRVPGRGERRSEILDTRSRRGPQSR